MDDNGTQSETIPQTVLISVKSGSACRLVGISEEGVTRGLGKGHEHRGWGERRHGHHWFRPGFERHHRVDYSRMQRRLLDLGLTKDCIFKVIHGSRAGPVLVEVRGTRIALGHGLARRVLVEVLEGIPE